MNNLAFVKCHVTTLPHLKYNGPKHGLPFQIYNSDQENSEADKNGDTCDDEDGDSCKQFFQKNKIQYNLHI